MRDLYLNAIDSVRQTARLRAAPARSLADTDEIVLPQGALRTSAAASPATQNPNPQDLYARRIVIADDNRDVVDSLRMLLEMDGHKVYATHDGPGAIQLAKALKPDVVLLDIAMPTVSGYDVARQIRSRPWGVDMELVAITGWARPEDRSRAMKAGFDYHLIKPIRLDVLSGILTANAVASAHGAHP